MMLRCSKATPSTSLLSKDKVQMKFICLPERENKEMHLLASNVLLGLSALHELLLRNGGILALFKAASMQRGSTRCYIKMRSAAKCVGSSSYA